MVKRALILPLILALGATAGGAQTHGEWEVSLKPVHYSLDLSIDYVAKKIHGRCVLKVVNASDRPTASVPLILYRLLKVTSAREAGGRPLAFRQNVVSFEDWETLQTNFVEVDLGAPLSPGRTLALELDYEGYILGYSETGMLYVKDRVDEAYTMIRTDALAYPEVGYPSWKVNTAAGLPAFTYDVRATAPKDLVVANGGRLLGVTVEGDSATTSYESLKPSWRMDIALAKFRLVEDRERNLRVFSLDATEAETRLVLDAVSRSMALYTTWFGPLRGESGFTIIEMPADYGGQADATCILLTPDAFKDKGRLHSFYHEVSHLWNVKALDPQPSRFESEGLATFLEYLVQEKLEGRTDALSLAETKVLAWLRDDLVKKPEAARTAMIDFGKADLTDLSYTKGMIFFDLLYQLMGEKEFLAALASFIHTYAETGATSQQFIDHLAAHSSVKLDKLFGEWVTGSASSRYVLDRVLFGEILKHYP